MEKEQRTRLQKATQDARKLLEEEFRSQLLQTYDIDVEKVRWAEEPGVHLQAEQRLIREKLVAWIEHKQAQIQKDNSEAERKKAKTEALLLALREMAFTALNRFVALKLMEARELVRPCVSGGLESAGFLEFTAVAQGLLADQDSSYRLYLETIFEDVSRELRALFDPRDPASLLWPKRTALLELLGILNRPELAELWSEDETLGWVYQYFNGDAERKKMREESAAPRNSRELAVRNQFFTPRYVVEFLTDNTLGRIWYEMRQGNTTLKDRCRHLVRRPNEIWLQPGEEAPAQPDADEALSQEELLRQPVHILHRELKDPREIRMLDPACGSMHFGLYAFDLYLEIYTEAWEIAQCCDEKAKQAKTFAPFVAYAEAFADKASFLREVPRLILLHNIHGIDIDPRATQIARLTLWLRAQRAWQKQQLQVSERPAITRSNVVCAEPMPGEKELMADFVDQQFPEAERGLVQQLLEVIFDKMQLAGEAGSLLKIEEAIRDAIDQAQKEWQKLAIQQRDLFSADELVELGQVGSSMNADLQNLTKDFWSDIEERIYAALREYAEQHETGGFQCRLFAEDAAEGFAFIDICRKSYDVALMNPPFGRSTDSMFEILRERFPHSYIDQYCCFVEQGGSMCSGGLLGAITSRSFVNAVTLERFRERIIAGMSQLLDLGRGVLDNAEVEVAAMVLSSTSDSRIEVIDSRPDSEKAPNILLKIRSLKESAIQSDTYLIPKSKIKRAPKRQILYKISDFNIGVGQKTFEPAAATVRTGLNTFDNFRFIRCWWEVSSTQITPGRRWEHYSKGGNYETFFDDIHLVLNRENDGAELAALNVMLHGQAAQSRQSHAHYYLPGLIYTIRAGGFNVRHFPAGCVFSIKGPVIQPSGKTSIPYLAAFLNSEPIRCLVQQQGNKSQYMPSIIKGLPWEEPDTDTHEKITKIGLECIRSKMSLYTKCEENVGFALLFASFGCKGTLGRIVDDNICLVDRCNSIIRSSSLQVSAELAETHRFPEIDWKSEGVRLEDHDIAIESEIASGPVLLERIILFMFGVAFGRWDIRYTTGEHAPPELPDPFAPLPVCPPGLLQNAQGLPACPEDVPAAYPVRIPWDGILVDDPNHLLDLERRVREVIEVIWSGKEGCPNADIIEQEACDILGVKTLRDYFRKPAGFFASHLSRYSKSRRQAPIYWQLSAGSGSYLAWLYYHRFTNDTLYRVLRDFVEPRIQQAEREQFELESHGALSGDSAARLQEAQTLLQDLRILKGELELVAPLWNPNLNDGVIINHAILWRITPYTPWQKKCKECWDKLVKGDYDWAHLAFHLWTERVIPKCTTDRSLAIAHGLEERLWQETNNGNWLPRQLSEADLQALIAEHSKPAVKNALERFLAAPPPVAPTRTRASRSTRASGSSAPRRPRGTAAVVDAEATRQVLLALTAAPSDGLAKAAIADLIGVEANALTAVIKQLKESGQIDQIGAARGARYVLTETGRAAVEQEEAG
jgi:hypothetical protein